MLDELFSLVICLWVFFILSIFIKFLLFARERTHTQQMQKINAVSSMRREKHTISQAGLHSVYFLTELQSTTLSRTDDNLNRFLSLRYQCYRVKAYSTTLHSTASSSPANCVYRGTRQKGQINMNTQTHAPTKKNWLHIKNSSFIFCTLFNESANYLCWNQSKRR